jgi:hypothetical protein
MASHVDNPLDNEQFCMDLQIELNRAILGEMANSDRTILLARTIADGICRRYGIEPGAIRIRLDANNSLVVEPTASIVPPYVTEWTVEEDGEVVRLDEDNRLIAMARHDSDVIIRPEHYGKRVRITIEVIE